MDFSKYDKRKLLLLLLFSFFTAQAVAAQNFADMVQNIPVLQDLTGDRIEQLYDSFWWLWDFAVYALILSTALKMGAQKALGDNAGKMGSIFAIVLSIGAVIAENQIGFNLKEFGPLALAIGIFAFGLYLWRIVKGMGLGERGRLIMGILYLTIYALISPRLKGLRDAIGSMNWIISVADILAAVFVVLVVIDLFNFVKNLRGGGGGGGGGGRPGEAAAVERGDQTALADEEKERKLQAQEADEEVRQMNDLRAIQAIASKQEMKYEFIRQYIRKAVGLLERLMKIRPVNPTLVDDLRSTLMDVQRQFTVIKNLDADLRARVIDLNNMEIAELRTLNALFTTVQDDVNKLAASSKVTGPTNARWGVVKRNFTKDAKKQTTTELKETREQLDAHIATIVNLEGAFVANFNGAEQALGLNNLPRAKSLLEAAEEDVKKLEAAERTVRTSDVNRLRARVQRKLRDVQGEIKTNMLTEIGLRKDIPALKRAAATSKKGLGGVGGFLIKGVGKITKIRRGP